MSYTGQELIITVGIPASGKSDWAKKYSWSMRKEKYFRIIERDVGRAALCKDNDINNYKYTKAREAIVTEVCRAQLKQTLNAGASAIISDTGLNHANRVELIDFMHENYPMVKVTIKSFDTSLKTCIKRNLKRHSTVPESAMIRMERNMREYLEKPMYSHTEGLPHCIIVDIDGTVADMKGVRGPFEWDKVGGDKPIRTNINLIKGYMDYENVDLIIFSGRDSICWDITIDWLHQIADLDFNKIVMREEGSQESDDIVKERFYDENIHGKYNVDFVMDDRKQVCQMWESIGLPLINVGGTLSDF